ncbi:MAG: hypothetical protein ACFFAY_10560 [Promethearchaeota archaeon]
MGWNQDTPEDRLLRAMSIEDPYKRATEMIRLEQELVKSLGKEEFERILIRLLEKSSEIGQDSKKSERGLAQVHEEETDTKLQSTQRERHDELQEVLDKIQLEQSLAKHIRKEEIEESHLKLETESKLRKELVEFPEPKAVSRIKKRLKEMPVATDEKMVVTYPLTSQLPAPSKALKANMERLKKLLGEKNPGDFSHDELQALYVVADRIAKNRNPLAAQFLLKLSERMRLEHVSPSGKVLSWNAYYIWVRFERSALERIVNRKDPVFGDIAVAFIMRWPGFYRGWNDRALQFAAEAAVRRKRVEVKGKLLRIYAEALRLLPDIGILGDGGDPAWEIVDVAGIVEEAIVHLCGNDALKVLQSYFRDLKDEEIVTFRILDLIEKAGGDIAEAILRSDFNDRSFYYEDIVERPLFEKIIRLVHKRSHEASLNLIAGYVMLDFKSKSKEWVKSLHIRYTSSELLNMLRSRKRELQWAACKYLAIFPRSATQEQLRKLVSSGTDIKEAAMALAAIGNSNHLDLLINWLSERKYAHEWEDLQFDVLPEIVDLAVRGYNALIRDVEKSQQEPKRMRRYYQNLLLTMVCVQSRDVREKTQEKLPYFADIIFADHLSENQRYYWIDVIPNVHDRIDLISDIPEIITTGVYDTSKIAEQIPTFEGFWKFIILLEQSPLVSSRIKEEGLIDSLTQHAMGKLADIADTSFKALVRIVEEIENPRALCELMRDNLQHLLFNDEVAIAFLHRGIRGIERKGLPDPRTSRPPPW